MIKLLVKYFLLPLITRGGGLGNLDLNFNISLWTRYGQIITIVEGISLLLKVFLLGIPEFNYT